MGFTIRKPADAAGHSAPAILAGAFIAFGGVLYGQAIIPTYTVYNADSEVQI